MIRKSGYRFSEKDHAQTKDKGQVMSNTTTPLARARSAHPDQDGLSRLLIPPIVLFPVIRIRTTT
jgi:hypothetical protein